MASKEVTYRRNQSLAKKVPTRSQIDQLLASGANLLDLFSQEQENDEEQQICVLCKKAKGDEINCGELLRCSDIYAHYYCLVS